MGKRTFTTTKDYILNAALPDYGPGSKYAVIPHGEIMEVADDLLIKAGFSAVEPLYKSNMDGDVVRGVYHLGGSDSEMEMMFAWVNSYDKSKRFQVCIGARVFASGGYWIGANMGNYARKHTGNAKQEAIDAMSVQIAGAGRYFSSLVTYKEEMKLVILPERLRAEFLGRILFQLNLVNLEQASVIRTEIMQPKDYNADKNSLWALLNHINLALNKSHPRDWMTRCIKMSDFINKEFGIGQPKGDPKQIDLLDMIAEVEAENNSPEVPPEPEISFEL